MNRGKTSTEIIRCFLIAAAVQQPAGQKEIFWIDAPGHRYTYGTNEPIDSVTQVQNFTSKVCSIVNIGACFEVKVPETGGKTWC